MSIALDIKERFLQQHGFTRVDRKKSTIFSMLLNEWEQTFRFCNGNCIGCEYCLHVRIGLHCSRDDVHELDVWLYKPLGGDGDCEALSEDVPYRQLFLHHSDRTDFVDIIDDIIVIISQVMESMDFHQLSGTEFADFSNATRSMISHMRMTEFERLRDEFLRDEFQNLLLKGEKNE